MILGRATLAIGNVGAYYGTWLGYIVNACKYYGTWQGYMANIYTYYGI